MIEKDTIKLLRECDAGIKMGVQSIEDSLKYTSNGELKRTLEKNLAGHVEIQEKLQGLLNHIMTAEKSRLLWQRAWHGLKPTSSLRQRAVTTLWQIL